MKSFGYYSFTDPRRNGLNGCSNASSDRPLIVNCAGRFSARFPFTTHNPAGRLDHYLIYILSGELSFFDGEKRYLAGEGSLVLLPAGKGYKYTYCGEKELSYLWVHFTGSEALRRVEEYSLEFFPAIYRTVSVNHISQRFQAIFDAFEKQDTYRDRELSALLERLLIAVARAVEGKDAEGYSLSRSVRYIVSNYSSDIAIPTLAAMENLSVSRYDFLFKEKMGLSPKKYILQLRMSSARELLVTTDLPVKQIGKMCGYEDPHFFSKTFKGFFGVSPAEYKKGIREED